MAPRVLIGALGGGSLAIASIVLLHVAHGVSLGEEAAPEWFLSQDTSDANAVTKADFGVAMGMASAGPLAIFGDAFDDLDEGMGFLDAAKTLLDFKDKWNKIKKAIGVAADAASEVGVAVGDLAGRLDNIQGKISSNDNLQYLFDGKVTFSDLKLLGDLTVCVDIIQELLSCSTILEAFGNLATKVLKLVAEVKAFTDQVAEVAEEWFHVDLDAFAAVRKRVESAVGEFEKEARNLAAINVQLEPLHDGLGLGDVWYAGSIMDGVKKLGIAFKRVLGLNDQAQQLSGEMTKSVSSFKDVVDKRV